MSMRSDYNDGVFSSGGAFFTSPGRQPNKPEPKRDYRSQLLDLENENAELRSELSSLRGLERERAATIRALKAARERELEYAALKERYEALEVLAADPMTVKAREAALKIREQKLADIEQGIEAKMSQIDEQTQQLMMQEQEVAGRLVALVEREDCLGASQTQVDELNRGLAEKLIAVEELGHELRAKRDQALEAVVSAQRARREQLRRGAQLRRSRVGRRAELSRLRKKVRGRRLRQKIVRKSAVKQDLERSATDIHASVLSMIQQQVQAVSRDCAELSFKVHDQNSTTRDLLNQFESFVKKFEQTESKLQQKVDQLAENINSAKATPATSKVRAMGASSRARNSSRVSKSAVAAPSRSPGRTSGSTSSRSAPGGGGGMLAGLMKQNIELMRD